MRSRAISGSHYLDAQKTRGSSPRKAIGQNCLLTSFLPPITSSHATSSPVVIPSCLGHLHGARKSLLPIDWTVGKGDFQVIERNFLWNFNFTFSASRLALRTRLERPSGAPTSPLATAPPPAPPPRRVPRRRVDADSAAAAAAAADVAPTDDAGGADAAAAAAQVARPSARRLQTARRGVAAPSAGAHRRFFQDARWRTMMSFPGKRPMKAQFFRPGLGFVNAI